MIEKITNYFKQWKQRRLMKKIRILMNSVGINTSKYTDKELEDGIISMTQIMRKTGISVKQATENLNRAIKAMEKENVW